MSSREKILSAITAAQPAFVEAPIISLEKGIATIDLVKKFEQILENIGGKAVYANGFESIKEDLDQSIKDGGYIVNTLPEIGIVNPEINADNDAVFLEPVFKAYIRGTLGVAENGSIWLYESQMVNRLLPFICQHLILVIETKSIVGDMHDAYAQLDVSKEGYGVFLAGPSKTADIEQSLVIGAHGARSLVVYLV
jgi:L-lactate dehydrogenase complex protein LldG